ncbi:hypothetical protein HNR46_000587 [Haloferula luteola]|uniref:Outer membrane beta-barrel protein n=1 Tax=Haloferula luteola TaxID=595692 RepID=A0A840UZE6_9BACT|nr:hypothetical protein [Haloferula luteola]MBB5350363.1 hypothetical protein [Haloferula luteola]
MKSHFAALLATAAALNVASAAEGLYYIGSEAQESLPLKWVVGMNAVWDDNVSPTATGAGANDEAFSLNPYVGVSFVNITPQSTLDVYARLGLIYYIDEPAAAGTDDLYPQTRVGVNWTHRFNERLRFSSRNFVSYELEPDYAYGFASSRQLDAYLYAQTDNSIGYRWTERLATYTGFNFSILDYENNVSNSDRTIWGLYQQFRYQLTPQSVVTFDYRYSQTDADGLAADSDSHYFLLGLEHRFSPNTILIARGGAQVRETDAVNGSDGTSPFVEVALRSRINDVFSIRGFARYGSEVYDTVRQTAPLGPLYDFDDRRTMRLGITGEYAISPMLSVFGGVDYITAKFDDGRLVAGAGAATLSGIDEDLVNAYLGLSVKFTDSLYGTVSYNYTDSNSDFVGYSYDRNRVSVGVRAEF